MRELLDHGVMIRLGAGTTFVFVVLEQGGVQRVIPASLVILFAVSVTKVKCISRSKVLLQHQVKYITGSEKMK